MALGFEKMAPGSLGSAWNDRVSPTEGTNSLLAQIEEEKAYPEKDFGPGAPRIFAAAGLEYCEKYGATQEHIASISAKNHTHSDKNPYAQFRAPATTAQVMGGRKITRNTTLLQCSPTSDGGAAAIVCSEAFVKKHNLQNRAIEVAGMGIATDSPMLYDAKSRIELAGSDMTRRASKAAYKQAGLYLKKRGEKKISVTDSPSLPLPFLRYFPF